MRVLLSVALFVLAGCDGASSVKTEFGHQSGNVYEVTLRDGTRCAVAYRGGIDCDWRKARLDEQ